MADAVITDAPTTPQGTDAAAPVADAPTIAAPANPTAPVDGDPAATTAEKPAEGAPEVYADFTVPEGKTLQPDFSDDLKAAAKELGLSQAAAQKLVDLSIARGDRMTAQVEAQRADALAAWESAVKADKEIGGDKLDANMAIARAGMKAYATPELVALLKETGMEGHPEMVRFMLKVGQSVSPDRALRGGQPQQGGRKSLYSDG